MANFKSSSRYSKKIVEKNRSGQDFIVLRKPISIENSSGDIYLTITQDLIDRPDLISFYSYGTHEYWWAILEFNNIKDPIFEMKIGQVLVIPTMSKIQEALDSQRI